MEMPISIQNLKYSGIYQIKNKITNKIYIGSAIKLSHRLWSHFRKLELGKHGNILLQRAFDKYGYNSFEVIILESCEKQNLINREQYYLDTLKPEYNICKIAGSTLGQKMKPHVKEKLIKSLKEKIYTEEERQKMSERRKGKKMPKEVVEKIVKTKKEKYNGDIMSKEARKKANENTSKKLKGVTWVEKYGEKEAQKRKNNLGAIVKNREIKESTKIKLSKIKKEFADKYLKGKTFEEIFGEEKATLIKQKIKESCKNSIKVKNARIEQGKKLKGKKQSEEHKNKRATAKSIPLKVTSLINNTFSTYKSISEFSKNSNISEATIINALKKDGIMKYKKLKVENIKFLS